MMRTSFACMSMAVMFSCALARSLQVSTKLPPVSTEGDCDPSIDMVFMLNGRSTLLEENFQSQQKFVRDIVRNHNSPTGTVHIGFVVCSENNVTSIPLQTTKTNIMTSLDILKRSNSVYHTSETIDCIGNVYRLFRESNRPHTSKQALLIIGNESHWSKQHADSLSKEAEINRISLLVVGVGIQDFLTLHSLQNIASETSSLFVLASYFELRRLSAEFSTGSCLPISFSMISFHASSTIAPKTTASSRQVRCKVVGDGKGYLKEVPFLGWQRRLCKEDKIVDVISCTCVNRRNILMLNDDKAPIMTEKTNIKESNNEILVERKINVSQINHVIRDDSITAEFKAVPDSGQVGNSSTTQSKFSSQEMNIFKNESTVSSKEVNLIRQTSTYSTTSTPHQLTTMKITSHPLRNTTMASDSSLYSSHFTPTLTNESVRFLNISTNSSLHFHKTSIIKTISSDSPTVNNATASLSNFTSTNYVISHSSKSTTESMAWYSSNSTTANNVSLHSSNYTTANVTSYSANFTKEYSVTLHSSSTGNKLTSHSSNSSLVNKVPSYSSNSSSVNNVPLYSSNSTITNTLTLQSSNSNTGLSLSNFDNTNSATSHPSNSYRVNNVTSYSSNSTTTKT